MAGSHGQQHQAAIQRKICTSTTVLLDYHDGTGAAFPFSTAFLGSGKTTRTEEVEQSDMEGSFSLHTLAIEEKLDLTVAGLRAGWHGSLVLEILAPRRFLPGLLIDFLNPRNRQKWPHPSLLKFLIETNRQTVNRLASQRSEVVGLSFQRRSSTSKVSRRGFLHENSEPFFVCHCPDRVRCGGTGAGVESADRNEEAGQRPDCGGVRRPLGANFWRVRQLRHWIPPGAAGPQWFRPSLRAHDVRRHAGGTQRCVRPRDRGRRRLQQWRYTLRLHRVHRVRTDFSAGAGVVARGGPHEDSGFFGKEP